MAKASRISKSLIEPTQIDWARLAAFIDGEGTIRIAASDRSGHPEYSRRYNVQVIVTNTDPTLMRWISERFPGNVLQVSRLKNAGNRKPLFRWFSLSRNAEHVLAGCLDFFIIKRRQADVALALLELPVSKKGVRVSQDLLSARQAFHFEMKQLNSGADGSRPAYKN